MRRTLLAMVVVVGVIGSASAQPASKPSDAKALVTIIHNVKPLLEERGKSAGIADTDAILKLILESIPVGDLKPGTDGPQIIVRENGQLEVRAPAKVQDEIADLLGSLARLGDLAVDLKADVFAFNPATFEQWHKAIPSPAPRQAGSPILFATRTNFDEDGTRTDGDETTGTDAVKMLKSGRLVQTSTVRIRNGASAPVSARQSLLTYTPHGEPPARVPKSTLFVKEGFKLLGSPVVSADRRFIRLKLTEESTAVTAMLKRVIEELPRGKIVATSPATADLGMTASTTIPNGGTIVFRLAYAPKDEIWVVVLRPMIALQAE